MKKYFLGMMICLFFAFVTKAQQASAPPHVPQHNMQPPPPAPAQELQEVATYKGTVIKMNFNDDYIYNGFFILYNGDSLLVKFPPYLGTQVISTVKTGSAVLVNGVLKVAPTGKKEVKMLNIISNGKTFADTAASIATPPTETYISGNGKITQLQTNREGNVSGLIIDDKTILRIPPHISGQLSSIITTNTNVAYTGMKKTANQGEALAKDYTIVHCKTFTVNGQQYLVQ